MNTLEYLQNKYKLDYSQKSPIEIPGVSRLDIIRWIRELELKVGVEVGVDRGTYSKLIRDYTPMKLYGVDPYLKYEEYREYKDQEELDWIYKIAQANLHDYVKDGSYSFIHKTSQEALLDFEDDSLDFVYLDANHEGDFPYKDIVGWAKKVRSGGLVCGHDYVRIRVLNFTIKDALEKYTKENNIHPWFILGSYAVEPGVVRDRTRSWAFVQP